MDEDWVYPAAVLVAVEFIIAALVAAHLGFAVKPNAFSYFVLAAVAALFAGIGWFLFIMTSMYRRGVTRPALELWQSLLANRQKIIVFAIGFQLVALQWAALGWLKQMLPLISPFWADPLLADFDRAIFGKDPWLYLHPTLDPIGGFIDLAYASWFPIKAVVMALVLSRPASAFKTRAMIAFFLTTAVFGAGGQFLMSSAGPIFFERLGLGDRFADLPIHEAAALGADYLWTGYALGVTEIGGGISAMPSLHVANAAWVALVLTAMWRPLGLFGWTFYTIILVGSVYLGWHYAVDGIAGTGAALIAWKLSAWTVRSSDEFWMRAKSATD